MDFGGVLVFVVIVAVGYVMFTRTSSSVSTGQPPSSGESTETAGYCEPAHEAVDPSLLTTNKNRFSITETENGPFGVRRFIQNDIGRYHFPTSGPSDQEPGMYAY